ncbi:MAG: transferase [Firmicutes bacterium HGW-Firmicutes-12]|jgi:acetyltransferase-like isoleucine patch superfamily enzyme|nr:MAG: transferase [Firmicutes bacterium HGW-Firmicutes-12]
MNNSKIFDNVKLGKNVTIGDFVILGEPPRNAYPGELELIIGDGAIIRSHTTIYAGNIIGKNFQTGHHVTIRENNQIGNNISIGTGSCIEHHIIIGDNARIHSRVFIPEFSIIEKEAWIGPNVVMTNANYPKSESAKQNLNGPRICENAKIGGNSTILPGVTVGENALVGAGSVVTKNIESNDVVVGNPAKKIKKIFEIDEYEVIK